MPFNHNRNLPGGHMVHVSCYGEAKTIRPPEPEATEKN
jgi:hypothetical protein